jgi:hypothetical protein
MIDELHGLRTIIERRRGAPDAGRSSASFMRALYRRELSRDSVQALSAAEPMHGRCPMTPWTFFLH